MKTNHLNPKIIKTVKENSNTIEFTEKPFYILEWINPIIVSEFGANTVLKAVKALNLTFYDLSKPETVSTLKYRNHSLFNRKNVFHIDWSKEGTKYSAEDKCMLSFTEYHLSIPSDLKDGNIIQWCMLYTYPFLMEFHHHVKEKINPLEFQTSYVRLKDIPEELHNKTIKQIIELAKPVEVDKEVSSLLCYSLSYKDFNEYEMYLRIDEDRTLYIPYNAFKGRDWDAIAKRNIDYLSDYYGGREELRNKALSVLTSKQATQLEKYLSQR